MKFAVLGFLATSLVASSVSAQALANSSSSVAASVVSTTTTAAAATTTTSVSTCAVQSTFELCLQNEDNYIKTCQDTDYACLCRWNKEKLTCWNNCPNDDGLAAQQGVVSTLCSMPGANVSIPLWTSSVIATSTAIVQSSVAATSANTATATPTNTSSAASALAVCQGALVAVGAVAAYFVF